MKCPCCSGPLQEVHSSAGVVDVCKRCRGIWFDDGELGPFAKRLSDHENLKGSVPRLFEKRDVGSLYQVKEAERLCPRCNKPMRKFNYAYDSNVLVDRCVECGGIWTDGGEALGIARYLKTDPRVEQIARCLVEQTRKQQEARDQSIGEVLMQPVGARFLFMPRIILPLSDDTARERFPFVTVGIIVLCTTVFAMEMFLVPDIDAFVDQFGYTPANGISVGMVTSIFLHGGILHLVGNMFFLWLFGDNVEDRMGRLGYPVFFLIAGIVAGIAHGLVTSSPQIPAIGASGAISGVMGAYLTFFPKAKVKMLVWYTTVNVPAWLYLGGWFGMQLLFGTFYESMGMTDVAWFAHIGGFAFGVLAGVGIQCLKRREARA